MIKHILYGVEISYYTGKARSYLRWKGVEFEERPSDRAFYKDIAIPRVGYPMIPVLITPEDQCLQDTTAIMDHFEAAKPDPSFTPATPKQHMTSLLLELYGDEWLVIPAMHYRWNYDEKTTLTEFGMNVLPGGTREQQYAMGEKVAGPFRGALPFLGITEETQGPVEASYLGLLAELDAHFQHHDFLFGDRPSTGDFGLVGALYAHLYRDATAGKLMRDKALAVARYVERMMSPNGRPAGEWLSDDEIPETLLPVLQRMMREQMPVLADTVVALATWKEGHPETEIPRVIGSHEFTLEGVTASRAIRPYPVWMLGRARNYYAGLAGPDKASADKFLEKAGGGLFRDTDIPAPVTYKDYKIVWA